MQPHKILRFNLNRIVANNSQKVKHRIKYRSFNFNTRTRKCGKPAVNLKLRCQKLQIVKRYKNGMEKITFEVILLAVRAWHINASVMLI